CTLVIFFKRSSAEEFGFVLKAEALNSTVSFFTVIGGAETTTSWSNTLDLSIITDGKSATGKSFEIMKVLENETYPWKVISNRYKPVSRFLISNEPVLSVIANVT